MKKSLPFFESCLAPLGIRVIQRQPEFEAVIFAGEAPFPFFWLGPGRNTWWREDQQPGLSPIHLAFPANSRAAVDEFYRQGLLHGGADNGTPGERAGDWYAAYLIDPDGNNIEAGMRHGLDARST